MLLHQITLTNLLSFSNASLALGRLNVLIGPNASGKSNLIEIIGLIRALPHDLNEAIRAGGGISEWQWKGEGHHFAEGLQIDCLLEAPYGGLPMNPFLLTPPPSVKLLKIDPVRARYLIRMMGIHQNFYVSEERLENEPTSADNIPSCIYAHMQHGVGILNAVAVDNSQNADIRIKRKENDVAGSILLARRDPLQFPEITHYAQLFEQIAIYRSWKRGQLTDLQPTDLQNDILREDGANLALILNRMDNDGSIDIIESYMRRFYPRFKRLTTSIVGRRVQLLIHEKGLSEPIPATRASDGTLRFLCLLSILCNRMMPPLICIDEPELGMHPDALPLIAEAMVEAAQRTQLIVTTHSEALIDALSDRPESIVVCEHDDQYGTRFKRLDKDSLNEWLQEYTLGELWKKGEIGGKL